MPREQSQIVHRKIALLGFRAVGKTSLTTSFVMGTFDETYDPTIENTHHKNIRFRKVHFSTDIVDTAGMDEYSRLSRNALVGVDGYVMVFSMTSRISFDRINQINESLLGVLGDSIDIPRVLVGNMLDLSEQRQVSYMEAKALADTWGIPYIECSCKTGENVHNVFHAMLREVSKDDDLFNEEEDNGCIIC
jgi:Ras family protein